jgi:hypothetical protein
MQAFHGSFFSSFLISMRSLLVLSVTLALSHQAFAVAAYGQCGGIGYAGSTVCDSGNSCVVVNSMFFSQIVALEIQRSLLCRLIFLGYYSQCQPGATTTVKSTSTQKPTTTTTSPSSTAVCSGSRTKFTYFGVGGVLLNSVILS